MHSDQGENMTNIKAKYAFFDVETTGVSPSLHKLITLAMYVTDEDYNILGEFYEKCTVGKDRIIKKQVYYRGQGLKWIEEDQWPWQAEQIHKITWKEQLSFQEPIELFRKLYKFLEQWPEDKITLVYHANASFDVRFLTYHSEIHAPVFYRYLLKRFSTFEYEEEHGYDNGYRFNNSLDMARDYNKRGKDVISQITKLNKTVDKMHGYLTKERKTPAKPAKIAEWKAKRDEALTKLESLDGSTVTFEGLSLDKICKALGLELDHHNAQSDAKVLIPIHKFLKNNS